MTDPKCARSPDRPTTSNEDVRLSDGVLVGGLAVVDPAMRVALVNEVTDVGFRKPVRHNVKDRTTGAGGTLRSEEMVESPSVIWESTEEKSVYAEVHKGDNVDR
jgi:hypothetical protein